jgi:hypothetical protein
MKLEQAERALLGELADVLIPASDTMPCATAAGVCGVWLDAVLAARPDLVAPLKTLLAKSQGQAPAAFLAELRASDAATFGMLGELAAAAYFMCPAVQNAIGYAGQGPREIDPQPEDLGELLEPVLRRGEIYRPTPID